MRCVDTLRNETTIVTSQYFSCRGERQPWVCEDGGELIQSVGRAVYGHGIIWLMHGLWLYYGGGARLAAGGGSTLLEIQILLADV